MAPGSHPGPRGASCSVVAGKEGDGALAHRPHVETGHVDVQGQGDDPAYALGDALGGERGVITPYNALAFAWSPSRRTRATSARALPPA